MKLVEFKQGQLIRGNSLMLKSQGVGKLEGICVEACRRWVKAKLTGKWKQGLTITALKDQEQFISMCRKHAKEGEWRHRHIPGAASQDCEATLRTEMEVIDRVLTEKGLYMLQIAAVVGKTGEAHAVAFDSRPAGPFAFFDPNQGEWTAGKDEGDAKVRAWWAGFWRGTGGDQQGAIDYAKEFPSTLFGLTRFSLAPFINY